MVNKVNRDVCGYLLLGDLVIQQEVKEARVQKTDLSKVRTSREEEAQRAAAENVSRKPIEKPETFIRQETKVGRNDPCPCGSGKKFKQCHGK
ncbi:MAG: SEC-C domain-containing protein [Saprospiraceae bacterium]|nr:SEC-C domain-containing protein [Saprospiraceae bacterium]